ncbi:tesmin/TSO1-like CXC domain protein, partial [Trifolium medium]|nr:tesmin/TSO1-like CXC domain protein [Trifolium medium]
ESSDITPKNAPLDSVTNSTSKKLARQLDFNAFGGAPVTAPLPEQPQPPPTLPPLPAAKLG